MLLPQDFRERLKANAASEPWVAAVCQRLSDAAKPWLEMSDETLWALMFGPTITRSWDVWSNGHCPCCLKDVPMYTWLIDALRLPWKVTCPHCRQIFPKNDFAAFYRSGLDERRLFDSARADRSLLVNAEHPAPGDPKRSFGVDDGEGFVEGEKRWRFIGAYLIYGQWKQLVLGGINHLAAAYAVTGNPACAHKAGILLDRVADLYPSFDHRTQAWVEEVIRTDGYVSTWHDACEETREMAIAYDTVRPAVLSDGDLAGFLAEMARRHGIAAPKATPADVCRNIENGILRDPLRNLHKIYSNYPRREIAVAVLHAALGWEANRTEIHRILDGVLAQATAVDGVTGEKGLCGYSAYVIQSLAVFLALMERLEPGTLAELFRRHPKLRQTYRFFIDTWCLQQYYPLSGDCGWFAVKHEAYCGVSLPRYQPGDLSGVGPGTALLPSVHEFLWKLYELTGDAAYVQALYHANGGRTDGLPFDLFARDPEGLRKEVAGVIARHGTEIRLGSVLKPEWHLAILRAGRGENARALWLDYDIAGNHGHIDAMNVGLFAKGLDLMPDFGYPPLQFEGGSGKPALWYRMAAAHNTVVVDGSLPNAGFYRRRAFGGRCTLWAEGVSFTAVRASGPELLLTHHLSEAADLSGEGHDRIGLYMLSPSRVDRVRALTKPEGGAAGDRWTLQFEDTFNRAELGPDWKVLEGDWRIEAGRLVGSGVLLCTRRFPGSQRLEFEATALADTPRDLSAFLAAGERGWPTGVFFGFGSNDNQRSKLSLLGNEATSANVTVTPGRRYSIICERDGDHIRHFVDGQALQSFINRREEVRKALDTACRGWQYERTLVQVNVSEADSYYLDIFRVVGGRDHAKFVHSHFGQIHTEGLCLSPAPDYGHDTLMRNFRTDPAPQPGWSVDWQIDDRHGYLAKGRDIHLRYTDLTEGAAASTCEGWVSPCSYNETQQAWIPRIMVRRQAGSAPLVGIIEPYEGCSNIASIRRLPLRTPDGQLCGDADVAVEVTLKDGRRDLLAALDVEGPLARSPRGASRRVVQPDWSVDLDGEFHHLRRAAD
jgi:hypothetical protein